MKPVAYHRLAASELIKSAKFYERRNPALREAFLSVVESHPRKKHRIVTESDHKSAEA